MQESEQEFDDIIKLFKKNAHSTLSLFDAHIALTQFLVVGLRSLKEAHNNSMHSGILEKIDRLVDQVDKVHRNESLEPMFRVLHNQSLVLLVMHFSKALETFYKRGLIFRIKKGGENALSGFQVKIPLSALKSEEKIVEQVVEIFIKQKDVSFQDMKSSKKAFHDLFKFEGSHKKIENNIIIAQACRHCLVHSESKIDEKFMNQVEQCNERSVLQELQIGDSIDISKIVFENTLQSMEEFLGDLFKHIISTSEEILGNSSSLDDVEEYNYT
jgi:hypothetical protein